ncbi:TonB-dependent receptor domain-containing protein [Acinetobacter sp. WZC-1]|uniref:TonB-dependent receptor domain-containing protein n=1 Tax=Acinetobacter sp. WZC-1 TaxID=3459034 RepID=UPI00403D7CDC
MTNRIFQSVLSLSVVTLMMNAANAAESQQNSSETQSDQPAKLQTIVVTAAGYEQDISKAPASMTVINREELDKREYTDITDVLRNVPGVAVTGSNGSAQTISIRGMNSSYTLFLINGKRQYSRDVNPNGDNDGFEKNILPPIAAIERIEVIRGPASTLYGSDAMGGVINIITKKVSDEWSGTVELGTVIQDSSKGGDIKKGTVYLSGPLAQNKLGLQLSASKQEREESSYVGGFRRNEEESLDTRLSYVVNDDHDLQFEANFVNQDSKGTVGKTIAPGPRGVDWNARNYRSVYSVTHNGRYSDTLDSTTYLQYEDSKNPDRGNTSLGTNGIELETWTFNNQWNWKLADHTLAFGAYYKDEKLEDRATNSNPNAVVTEFTRWSAAAFLEDTWSLTDKFNLTGGLRYDYDENYKGNLSPRLYGVYSFNDNFSLKGGVSTGYKQPDFRAVSDGFYLITGGPGSPSPTGRAVVKANPGLDPEKSVSYELAANWQNNFMSASLTGYFTQFKDRITDVRDCETDTDGSNTNSDNVAGWNPECSVGATPFYFTSQYINVDRAELKGIEATVAADLTEYLTLAANYTYSDTEIKSGDFKGQPLNGIPEHLFNITVDYNINDALNVWSRMQYRSSTPAYLSRTSMGAARPDPGYEFLDVGMNYKFTSNLKGKFGVYNLLDEKAENSNGDQILDGRRYGISLVASF